MSFNRGLIQNDKYFTQFGQLRTMGHDKFGDPVETNVTTVPLLVYQDDQREVQTTPKRPGTSSPSRAPLPCPRAIN